MLAIATILSAACAPLTRQAGGVADGNWPSYNRTVAGDRFSPLNDIDRSNVVRLVRRCEFALPEPTSFQTGPLAIDGTLYFTSPGASYAIDAATCKERWRATHPVPTGEGVISSNRGFAYLDGVLFRGTMEGHVVALSASDGSTLWDVTIPDAGPGVSIPMAPIAADGKVFIGNAGGDRANVTGHAYAFDAKTGGMLWRFEVVPDTPEVRATWKMPPGHPLSGGGLWTSMTYDEITGVLYAPSGNPAPDFDRELRQGDNLYVNSVLALDGRTGRLVAYNQLVKEDYHDWGLSGPPALVTTAAGKRIVASANKDGVLSVLDRSDVAKGIPLLFGQPTTTHRNVDVPVSREKPTQFCPGMFGGSEWNGAAFHPSLNTLFVGTVDWCSQITLAPMDAPVPKTGDLWLGIREPMNKVMLPWSTARGWLTAFDADTGAVRWKLEVPKPIVAAVTPTAGGLVFAADLTGKLYAHDAENGRRLWEDDLGQPLGGGIITYRAGGQQFLAAAVGNGGGVWPVPVTRSSVVVYALP
ncbi:pyrroloquinoline quinone-dependent dehydrogenase [Aquincola tertiaricarbonis]|uniref:pyrroloquinoline quinone-dependent dehydrogenase n=1 Tax=Aquincola tertiaricarbonis TaxID=391953 RepID=UPI0009F84236|nr:PQQ-binding-like beta-propeller repeat protein [Aquincola tertiaricarbonis]